MPCVTNERGRGRCIAAVCLVSLLCGRSARAEVVRLAELEQRALHSRASLQADRARVAAANARVDIAAGPMYPTLTAVANAEALPGSWLVDVSDVDGQRYVVQGSRTLGQTGAFTPQTRYGAGLVLNARIYDFGRTRAAVGAASEMRGAARARAHASRYQALNDLRAAYLGWLAAYERHGILEQMAREAEQLRQILEARIEEGTRPGAELATARYDEAQTRLDLDQCEAELAEARDRLEQAAGGKLPAAAEPDLAVLEQRPARNDARELANLSALRLEGNAARANARVQRRARAPLLSAHAEGGLRGQSSQLFPQYRVGLSLSMLLLDGGLAHASAALADAQASELSALAREARDNLESQRSRGNAMLERARRRLSTALAMLAAARDELTHARDQLELGTGRPDLIVQARRRVAGAELEVLAARVARAQLSLGIDR